jgi:type II secretory pathway pseudopilin PulG
MSPLSRRGWTLIELAIATTLLSVVLAKAVNVLRSAYGVIAVQTTSMAADDQARQSVDRIAKALMGAQRVTLWPSLEGIHTTRVRYRTNAGSVGGEIDWALEEIALAEGGVIRWRTAPDRPEERGAVWAHGVRPLLEGEVSNGIDDNGNGLIDEEGLSFVVDGDGVIIRLSTERAELAGHPIVQTFERRVRCRN